MGIWTLGLRALVTALVVAFLGACGAQSGDTLPPGTSAQSVAHKASGSYGDLVYAITAKAMVILSYPTWSIVARVHTRYYAVCSDPNNGNVFALDGADKIDEYAHGGTTPIATLTAPSGYDGFNYCSVDPTTGNLAASIYIEGKLQSAILIYPQAQGNPTIYSDKRLPGLGPLAYDNAGNLFVGAANKSGGFRIGEIKAGRNQFTVIKLTGHRSAYVYDIQWDGTYLVFLVPNGRGYGTAVNQVSIRGKTATIVNSFLLKYCQDNYFWIYENSLLSFYYPPKGNLNYAIAAWSYPAGGKPTSRIYGVAKGRGDYTYDLTVSVAASRSPIRR